MTSATALAINQDRFAAVLGDGRGDNAELDLDRCVNCGHRLLPGELYVPVRRGRDKEHVRCPTPAQAARRARFGRC